ncbi:ABC transporter permease [Actinomadura darangshiensis]|uniref:ABC transporter permease n=1 Tax=Actinomadura darangshiensis TaxID=705336 RepID=A0A4R5BLE6_9ACTN|nr:ABC transporter permease subunit [Actinomadura darangshiensis]TDD87638.1 ABC transporter permease [Actinomadura darangshiensis]
MRPALHAEWTKARTVAGPLWLLLGTIAATVALSAGAVSVARCPCGDMAEVSLIGVDLGQALVVILAVLVIAGEYGTGMIRTTLTAMPHRSTVLAAKAAVLTGIVAAAGTVAVLGSLLAGRLILPGHVQPLTDGPTLRTALAAILYLTLIALLGLGVATAVRDSATSIGTVLGLLYVFPVLSQTIGDQHWQRLLQRITPMPDHLGVTAAWAGAALLSGALLLHLRDA